MDTVTNTTIENLTTTALINSQPTENTKTNSTTTSTTDFSAFMRKALARNDSASVNEEELFAALIDQRLEQQNPEAATLYRKEKERFMKILARSDGHVQIEDVAKAALETTVAAGKIDEVTADQINSEAFSAAQLDDNHEALYDSIGGGSDTTIAVDNLSSAMARIQTAIEKIDKGEITVTLRSLLAPSNIVPTSSKISSGELKAADGSGGFLWKPISDSDDKLVVLLPTSLNNQIDKVEIHSSLPPTEETKLGIGRFTSIGNGNRSHFRFDKPGAEYGQNIQVVVYKDDGSYLNFPVSDGSKRID